MVDAMKTPPGRENARRRRRANGWALLLPVVVSIGYVMAMRALGQPVEPLTLVLIVLLMAMPLVLGSLIEGRGEADDARNVELAKNVIELAVLGHTKVAVDPATKPLTLPAYVAINLVSLIFLSALFFWFGRNNLMFGIPLPWIGGLIIVSGVIECAREVHRRLRESTQSGPRPGAASDQ